MASDYHLEIDIEASSWAGDLLYAVAVTLSCAHLMRDEGLHRGGVADSATAARIRRVVEDRIDGIPRMSLGRHHTRVLDPFDPSRTLSTYTWESDAPPDGGSVTSGSDRNWEITALHGYEGSEEEIPPWHRERRLTSAVGLTVDDKPRLGVIATQHSPDGAGEIVAWAEGEPFRRWIWSMYPPDSGPEGVDRWLGHGYDCLRTPEFLWKNAAITDLRDIPLDFHSDRIAGQALIKGLRAVEPPPSEDETMARILAIRKLKTPSPAEISRRRADSRSQLPGPPPDPACDAGWLDLSPLVRARAHGAFLGLVCGAEVAASMKPGAPDPNRFRPRWQPEVDQIAELMGLHPVSNTTKPLHDSVRAALVAAHTIIAEGEYRPEAVDAAYRRNGVYIEPTAHDSNWFLPRLVPIILFGHGVSGAIPSDVDMARYIVTDPIDEAEGSNRLPEAYALTEFAGMPGQFLDAERSLTHSVAPESDRVLRELITAVRRILFSAHEDPLAGIRRHKGLADDGLSNFTWAGDRRDGHLYRDQVAPFFNAPRDQLPAGEGIPRGPDDADLPPLPRGVGLGVWGDTHGMRGGQPVLGDRTQPWLEEPLYDIGFFSSRALGSQLSAPEEATGDFDLAATVGIINYHIANNLSLLSAIHQTMRLGGNTIVPTAMTASIIGAIHGWRAIPGRWIDAVDTVELSTIGIAGKDLIDGHIAEALIQTGYRWGRRWLREHGVDVTRLHRRPAPSPEEEERD